MVAFGVVLAAQNLCTYEAITRLPLGVVITIAFLGPLGVAVVGAGVSRQLAWPGIAALGVALLVDPGGGSGSLAVEGLAFAAGTAVAWAAYIVLTARVGARYRSVEGLALALAVSALLVLPFGIATASRELLQPAVLALGVVTALVTTVVAYSFETLALKRLSLRIFGVFASFEPVVAALVGLAALGQHLSAQEVAGMVLVTVACAGAARAGVTAPPPF